MQKRNGLLLLLILVLVCLAAPGLAMAEGFLAEDVNSFFSWEMIGTFSGAVAVVVFIVQLLKLPLDRIRHIPTQYVVYVVSLMVLLLAQAFVPGLGGLNWQNGILCVFNAILVALTAMSVYTKMIEEPERAKLVTEGVELSIIDGEIVVTDEASGTEIGTVK